MYINVSFSLLDTGVLGGAYQNTWQYFGNSIQFGSVFAIEGTFMLNTTYLTSMKNNVYSNNVGFTFLFLIPFLTFKTALN